MAKTQKKAKTAPTKSRPKARTAAPRERGKVTPAPPAARGKLERVRMPAQPAPKSARPQTGDDVNEGKYVYCIIKSERPLAFGALGKIGRAHVELQSLAYLVCRLLLEKKKNQALRDKDHSARRRWDVAL